MFKDIPSSRKTSVVPSLRDLIFSGVNLIAMAALSIDLNAGEDVEKNDGTFKMESVK